MTKRKKILAEIDGESSSSSYLSSVAQSESSRVPPPTSEQVNAFYERLNKCKNKPVLLRVLPGYCEQFSTLSGPTLPSSLLDLYSDDNRSMNYADLLTKCEEIFSSLSLTEEEAIAVNMATVNQSKSESWFQFRSGRITASVVKEVCASTPDQPPISLIKKICYQSKFRSIATDYGIENEDKARKIYVSKTSPLHENF